MTCVFLFYFKICNPLLYIPSICSNRICFKVQMTLGVQLGLDNQWKVYLNLRRTWIILINLCHFKHKTGFWVHVSLHRLSHLCCYSCICCFVIRSTAPLFCCKSLSYQACNYGGAGGGGGAEQPALPFFGIQNNGQVLEKKVLILSILRLNLSFKI